MLRKVGSNDGRFIEQGVNEMLHLKVANLLLDSEELPETLVLATRDGRVSEFGTSFPHQVERALRRGWQVEIWSWREQLSRAFSRITPTRPEDLVIHELDRCYVLTTFVRAGTYLFPDGKWKPVALRPVRLQVSGM